MTLAIDCFAGVRYNKVMEQTKGKLIVFEGTDGSGKSTQLKLLAKYLKQKGVETYSTCEPTDSPFGATLRACLTGRIETNEHTIAALFAADRIDHIFNAVNGIKCKLEKGITVLCDRFYLSSLAYNGGIVSGDWVYALNRPAMEAVRPDLTLFLDLNVEESMGRVGRRGETERYETVERQRAIRARYYALFGEFAERDHIKIIQSEADKTATQEHIRREADKLFGF